MLAFDKLFENKTLMFSAGAVAFLVAALLILFIFRLAFGRRLHMPGGGRARQPRLGVVDAFDLDRQRQLVLVRRDNVEHLVMIGGPNDVLIESQIVRAEARESPRPREKEPTVAPLSWPAGGTQIALPPSVTAEPKFVPEEPAVAARQESAAKQEPAAPVAASMAPPLSTASASTGSSAPVVPPASAGGQTPPPRPPFLPLPPRRPMPAPSFGLKPVAPPLGPATAQPGETGVGGSAPSLAPAPASLTPSAFPAPRPAGSPPSFLRPRPAATAPVAAVPPVQPAPPVPVPVETAIEPKGEKSQPSIDALESLEEEMAKLLGRNSSEP